MRVTKVSTTRSCAACERTLLLGERSVRFSPDDGVEFVDVCPLCQEVALDAGWIKEGSPTTPMIRSDRRRKRGGGLGSYFGFGKSTTTEPLSQQEPILRRLSDEEVALLEAADIFNASTYKRTVAGIVRSLGNPQASVVPLSGTAGELAITVAWDLSWYQYRVSPEAGQPIRLERRGHEVDELEPAYRDWNAHVEEDGRLVPAIARL
jgi:hypothetical protein